MTEEQYNIYKIINGYFSGNSLTEREKSCDKGDVICKKNYRKTFKDKRKFKNKREEKKSRKTEFVK
jgi:hypothetical protein